MRITLVVNPVASSVRPARLERVASALRIEHDLTVAETAHRGHATELARAAAAGGAEVVVALGGDGTVNEVANALAHTETALAPLPGGSTNVYTRTAGYHPRLGRALGQLTSALSRAQPARRVGLGVAGGRRFCFHAGIGFDAAVIERVDRRPPLLKRHASNALFASAAVATWRGSRKASHRFDLLAGGEVLVPGALLAVVSKTSPYTFLGPRRLLVAPDASFDTPLAVTALMSLDFSSLAGAAASALATGRRLREDARAVYAAGVERVSLRTGEPVPWQVDGERMGDALELELSYEPRSLALVAPGR